MENESPLILVSISPVYKEGFSQRIAMGLEGQVFWAAFKNLLIH